MDLVKSAVAGQQALTMQKASIAVLKAQNEMTQQLIDMVLENTENLKVAASSKGTNVDVSI